MQPDEDYLEQLAANLYLREKKAGVGPCASTKKPVDIAYHTFGQPDAPGGCFLLVMGLNGQALLYDDRFCEQLAQAAPGFFVVRYDNRDVGLSTKFDEFPGPGIFSLALLPRSWQTDAPYTLVDMATDGLRLLDTLHVERAHVLGVSMGGMLVQTMALLAPHRILSLTSIMSNTGSGRSVGPTMKAKSTFLSGPKSNAPEDLAVFRTNWVLGMNGTLPVNVQEAYTRNLFIAQRSNYNAGLFRQMAAIAQAPSRAKALKALARGESPMAGKDGDDLSSTSVDSNKQPVGDATAQQPKRGLPFPALVLHGGEDILVPPMNGIQTAAALRGYCIAEIESVVNKTLLKERFSVPAVVTPVTPEGYELQGWVQDDGQVRLVILDGMGHALPSYMIPFLVKEAVANAKRGAAHQQSQQQQQRQGNEDTADPKHNGNNTKGDEEGDEVQVE